MKNRLSRKNRDTKDTRKDKDIPQDSVRWVSWIQDWVRPAVAVIVLVMCAPGEHYLAHLAGWNKELAWGMPAVLTMYAGVAAVVATKRDKGAPGKRTAVVGAVLSITAAMAAQPVAHLYSSGWEPGDGWTYRQTLMVTVSCVPALVFGHLLHLAASPAVLTAVSRVLSRDSATEDVPQDSPAVTEDAGPAVPVPPVLPPAVPVPAAVSPAAVPPVPAVSRDTVPAPRVRTVAGGSMKSFVEDILSRSEDTPDSVLKDMVRTEFGEDTKPNTINTSIRRARSALAQSA